MNLISFVNRICQRCSDLKANNVKIIEVPAMELYLINKISKQYKNPKTTTKKKTQPQTKTTHQV